MRVVDVLAEGAENGTQIGAQLYVAHKGTVVADLAIGQTRAGVAMTSDSMMTWFSMTKAVTAVAVAQQWERGALDVDEPAARHLPELAEHGKGAITIRHLLNHTGGVRDWGTVMALTGYGRGDRVM